MKELLAENIAAAIADDNSGELEDINSVLSVKQRALVKLVRKYIKEIQVYDDSLRYFLRQESIQILQDNKEYDAAGFRICCFSFL